MRIIVTLFKSSPKSTATLSAPKPAAGHCWPRPLPETPGHSWASLSQSLVGSLLLSLGSWCIQSSICALQDSVSPVLCKFGQLYDGVNGDLLQEGLCHPQSAAPRAPAPAAVHCWPSPPHEALRQFCLSPCGVSGSWCAQGLFEPPERLWWALGLVLNVILLLLPPCSGFFFALRCGVSAFLDSAALEPSFLCY